MKIAILGGGITGLTAAYYLAKDGHRVTIIEKEKVLGGLAAGFKSNNWDWYLERAYHHLFSTDSDILNFAEEIGFNKIYFKSPITASLFLFQNSKFKILPLDTPVDLLKFSYLSFIDKIRAGIVIAFLKLSPFLTMYKNMTSEEFLKKSMGINVWNTLWKQLFRGKFGKYAEIISASFIWARIKKRTKRGEKSVVNNQTYDIIISTLPTPVLTKLISNIFPEEYLSRFNKLKYLHAITLILETDNPILNKTYWLNICTNKIPFMILAQHTNFADKKNYNNHHLAYIGWYVNGDSKLLKMDKDQLLNYVLPHLR